MNKRRIGANTFASFRKPGYRLLWLSFSLSGFAHAASFVIIGWLALELTGASFAVAMAVAFRTLPRAVLSIPLGSVADRYDRRRLLQLIYLFGLAVSVGAALAGFIGLLGFVELVVVALLLGIFDAALSVVSKVYVYDLVGAQVAVNGIALENLASKLAGIFGAFSAGVILEQRGASTVFVIMAGAYLCSLLALVRIKRSVRLPRDYTLAKIDIYSGIRLLRRNRAVLLLAVVAVAAELFAFSSIVLLPTFAKDIFEVGESGLGTLTAVEALGSIVGLLLLANASRRGQKVPVLLRHCALFALGLIAFAGTSRYSLALLLIIVIGGASAAVDSLLPTLLQDRVGDQERGAATGIWNLSLGLGLLGHLEIGALAGAVGAPLAQGTNGAILLLIIGGLALMYQNHRQDWGDVERARSGLGE